MESTTAYVFDGLAVPEVVFTGEHQVQARTLPKQETIGTRHVILSTDMLWSVLKQRYRLQGSFRIRRHFWRLQQIFCTGTGTGIYVCIYI